MISQTTIDEVAQRLVKAYQPVAIYLFGSYAWGKPTDESDLDLLAVVEKSDEKKHRRPDKAFDALWGICISKDIIVYTQEEFAERVKSGTSLCHKIKNEGRILYARA